MKSCEDWGGGWYIPPVPNDGILYSEFLSREELESFFENTLEFILKRSWRAYKEENLKYYNWILKKLFKNFEIAWKDWKKKLLRYDESKDIIFLIESISKLIGKKSIEFASLEKNKLFNSIPTMLMSMLRESVWIKEFVELKKDCLDCSEVCEKNKVTVFSIINNTRGFWLELNKAQDIETLLKSFYRSVLGKKMKNWNKLTQDELYWFIRFLGNFKRVLLVDEEINLPANSKNHSRSSIHTIILKQNMWQASFLVHEWKVVWEYYWYNKDALEIKFEDWEIAIPMQDWPLKMNYVNPTNGYSYFGVVDKLYRIGELGSEELYFVKRRDKEMFISPKTKHVIWCELDMIDKIEVIQGENFIHWLLNWEEIYIHIVSWNIYDTKKVFAIGDKTFVLKNN